MLNIFTMVTNPSHFIILQPLTTHPTDCTYNALDVGAFQRAGHRPNGSPTEAVLQDFISRGFTVDDLFLMLSRMGHVEGMKILKEYGQ